MPLPLAMSNVPIIGQPRVSNWFFTVQIVCPCGEPLLLIGQLGSRSACPNPECGKVYQLNGMPSMTEAGHVSVPLGMSVPVKPGSTS
jgi:hypothetical protein